MPKSLLVLLYGRERGESFLARAQAHAAAHIEGRVALRQRHVGFFRPEETEPATAVYVESRFAAVVEAYRRLGVAVFTEADLGAGTEGAEDAPPRRRRRG